MGVLQRMHLQQAFLQIYEERTEAGQDMGLIAADVEETPRGSRVEAAPSICTRPTVVCSVPLPAA